MKVFNARNTSLLSALSASACCLPPLILLLFSIGSVTAGAALARYHWWFLGVGVALLATSYIIYFRERKACNAEGCAQKNQKLTISSLIFGTVVVGGFAMNAIGPLVHAGPSEVEIVKQAEEKAPEQKVAVIPVNGMTCVTCELQVNKVLKELPGVIESTASTTNKSVVVTYDPAQATIEQLVDAINTKTGYKALPPEEVKSKEEAKR